MSDLPSDLIPVKLPDDIIPVGETTRTEMAPEQPGVAQALWESLQHGAGNVVMGGRQLAARIPGAPAVTGETPQQADTAARQRQQDYMGPFAPGPGQPLSAPRSHPIASGIGEFLGEVGATAPAMAATRGAAGPLIMGGRMALAGGATGALNPALGQDYWAEKAKQTALGAGVGAAVGGVGGLLAPGLSQDAQYLASRGMRPSEFTPGQRMGAQAGERTLQHYPVLHGYISGLSDRSLGEFDRAVVRQALEPIGAIMPRSVQAGHDMVAFADRQVEGAYNRLLPMLSPLDVGSVVAAVRANPQLRTMMSELGDDHLRRLEKMIDNRIITRFDPAGQMDGTLFKDVESSLGKLSRTYAGTNDAQLSEPLRQLQAIMRDAMAAAQADPAMATYLKNTNYAYAMMQRIRDAATRRAGSDGIFTPEDLLVASKGGDASTNHAVFAHGDALFQEFSEAAKRLMVGRTREMPEVSIGNTMTGAGMRVPYGLLDRAQRNPMLGGGLSIGAPAAGGQAGGLTQPRETRRLRPPVAGP